MSFLTGSPDTYKQLSLQTKGQESLLNQVLQSLMGMSQPGGAYQGAQSYLQQMLSGSPEAYRNFAAPHKQQFEQQTIPMLAERFAGLGGGLGGGALGSSGFGQALGGAGAQFSSNLAGLYAQLQQQAAQQALNQYNTQSSLGLGTRAFENVYQPGSTGALGGLLQGAGTGLGFAFGGPAGAALGSSFANMFSPSAGSNNIPGTNVPRPP